MGGAVRRHVINVEPYDYEVELWIGGPLKDVNAALEEAGVKTRVTGRDEGLVCDTDGAFVMWLRHTNANVIAHECVHLVWRVLREAQVPITYANEDVFAYHMGKLVEQVTKLARARRKAGA